MLRERKFKTQYNTEEDQIVTTFYLPALNEAISYDRAVGYFSISSLLYIIQGIGSLVEKKGKIRVICSPNLSAEDVEIIRKSYELKNDKIQNSLSKEIADNPLYKTREFILFSSLLEKNIIELKIAIKKDLGLYHEKIGIISDGINSLSFIGSLNETTNALFNNFESFDVYCDWLDEREAQRVLDKKNHFARLWDGHYSSIEVLDFPNAIKKELIELGEKAKQELKVKNETNVIEMPSTFKPRYYQEEAFKAWKNNRGKGLFTMATGTGKTLTALYTLHQINERVSRMLNVIVCPYQHLVEQWVEDIEKFNIKPVKCYSKYPNWESDVRIQMRLLNNGQINQSTLVCTNQTFASAKMQNLLKEFKCLKFIIVDEAHNAGTNTMKSALNSISYDFKLALSATPTRHRDEENTKFIFDYFGGEVFTLDLEEAIQKGFLCSYYYYPIIVQLNDVEYHEYEKLTTEIAKNIIEKDGKKIPNEYAKMLLIKRARIVAGAKDKLNKLSVVLKDKINEKNILIYCGATSVVEEDQSNDDSELIFGERQITEVTRLVGKDLGMKISKYTSEEDIDLRNEIIAMFTNQEINAIAAIKCLDEGVNIPSIETAIIMASSTNPKEYIQRRGRVLRQSPKTNKNYAYIYDMVCFPPVGKEEEAVSLIKTELRRVQEFGSISVNKIENNEFVQEMMRKYNIELGEDEDGEEFNT